MLKTGKRQRGTESGLVGVLKMLRKRKLIPTPEKRDVFATLPVELIHHIQSLLPVRESGRTCILSKLLLHSWSTIPTLRFPLLIEPQPDGEPRLEPRLKPHLEKQMEYHKFIDNTLSRYYRDKVPIQSLSIQFKVSNNESASLLENWIPQVASSCLKELSLRIWVLIPCFTLPDEIFCSENLDTIYIRAHEIDTDMPLYINPAPQTIKCVSLRVIELREVNISEQVIDCFFSTCALIEKFVLDCCEGYKTVRVKNLNFLRELFLLSVLLDDVLEMANLPSLTLFHYTAVLHMYKKCLPFNMDSLGTVTDLVICGVIMDTAFFDMIKSKLPCLESLYIGVGSWARPGEKLVVTSRTMKKLTIQMMVDTQINVQVYAPNLLSYVREYCSPGQVKVTIL